MKLGTSILPAVRANGTSAPTLVILFADQTVSHGVNSVATNAVTDPLCEHPENDISDYAKVRNSCFRKVSSRVRARFHET